MIELTFDDRIEEIYVSKKSKSKECDISHYWYFLNKGFKLQPNIYNGCHDLLMMTINLSDIAIFNLKGSDYCCIWLKKWNIMKHKSLLSHTKWVKKF